jgi:hypothetical protein
VTGLGTRDMKGEAAESNMITFDFVGTWDAIDNGTHISYPFLVANTQVPAPGLETVGQNPANFAVTIDGTNSPVTEGETLTEENLTTKRPGTGVPADQFYEVVGKQATRAIAADEVLQASDFE